MYPTLSVALNYHVPTDNYTKHGFSQYTFPLLGTYKKNQMMMKVIHPVLNHCDNNMFMAAEVKSHISTLDGGMDCTQNTTVWGTTVCLLQLHNNSINAVLAIYPYL